MTAAAFLAESKRIEEEATAGLARKSSTVEFVAWSMHAMEALPMMREALEKVLAIHQPSEVSDGFGGYRCSGCDSRWSLCATVRAIESALAENGEKK